MKHLFLVLTVLSMLVCFGAPALADAHCMDELGCVEVGPDDPIVFAAILSVSGATSFYGEDSLGGVELAFLGRDGMLLGRDITLVVEDELCSAEGGQAAAQRVAADESVVGIIGTTCSGAAQGAMPILSEAGMLMISSSNTSPRLTNDNSDEGGTYQPGYFRTAHNDLFQGAMGAQYAVEVLKAGAVATIHDGDPYTEGLAVVMANTFDGLNGEVVFQGAVSKGDTDMTAILTEIAASGPDVVYLPVFVPESEFLVSQAANTPGLEDAVMMTADGSFAAGFAQNTGQAAVGVIMTGPHVAGESYNAFLELWAEEQPGGTDTPPSGFHAHAYDAANLLMDAVEAVAEEMDDGTLIIGRQALRDAMAAVENYDGLTGSLTCQEESPFKGDCATGTALAVFEIGEAQVNEGAWPPPIVWDLSMSMGG
ncbi:MAG: branched-chain amino acid ABC transporter substrate-binding protein [Chloroflexota bacterium]|nr:branched-chain amino acid ABC transporter substrate-binding protein [Chloroflexota bacterium]